MKQQHDDQLENNDDISHGNRRKKELQTTVYVSENFPMITCTMELVTSKLHSTHSTHYHHQRLYCCMPYVPARAAVSLITCIVSPSSSMRRLPALVHGAGDGSSRRSKYLQTMNPDLPFSGQYFTTCTIADIQVPLRTDQH